MATGGTCSRRWTRDAIGSVIALALVGTCLAACTEESREPVAPPAEDAAVDARVQPSISIGIPDDVTGIRYEPLAAGGDVKLETYGQGGLHAVFIIQCVGMGNQAWVDIRMTNLGDYDHRQEIDAGAERDRDAGVDDDDAGVVSEFAGYVETLPSAQPSLLACDDLRDPVYCRTMPREVLTGGLAASLDALGDLHVEIRAEARNRDGIMLSDTIDAYLRR